MNEPVRPTPDEIRRLNRHSLRLLVIQLIVQFLSVLLVAAVAAIGWGSYAGISGLLGGLSYALPSGFFVAHMSLRLVSGVTAGPMTVFVAEAIKIAGCSVILFLAIRYMGSSLVWPAMLLGLLVSLKTYVLLLLFRQL